MPVVSVEVNFALTDDHKQNKGEFKMKKRISITVGMALAVLFGTAVLPISTSATTSTEPAVVLQDNCVVKGSNNTPLRVRATPGGRVIGSLKRGANILAYGIEQDNYGNDWTKIKYRKGYGFVSTDFISCG